MCGLAWENLRSDAQQCCVKGPSGNRDERGVTAGTSLSMPGCSITAGSFLHTRSMLNAPCVLFPLCVQLDFHTREHRCCLTYFILQYLILVTKCTCKLNLPGDICASEESYQPKTVTDGTELRIQKLLDLLFRSFSS